MDENESVALQDALTEHVVSLTELMESSDPQSEEYAILLNAVTKLTDLVVKIQEIEMKSENEEEQRRHEKEMEHLREEAAKEAREAEAQLKAIEDAENKRWHNIELGLRVATIVTSVASLALFGWTAWTQTRMNYVDNVYDVNGASRMVLQAIGKMVKPV